MHVSIAGEIYVWEWIVGTVLMQNAKPSSKLFLYLLLQLGQK